MSDKIQTVDVEKIMEEIRKNIEVRGVSEEVLGFNEVDSDTEIRNGIPVDEMIYDENDLNQYIRYARAAHNIPYYEPIQGGKLKVFVKRVMRKLMAFQMQPLRERQNHFNYNSIQCIRQLAVHMAELEDALIQKEEIIEELQTRIEAIENK